MGTVQREGSCGILQSVISPERTEGLDLSRRKLRQINGPRRTQFLQGKQFLTEIFSVKCPLLTSVTLSTGHASSFMCLSNSHFSTCSRLESQTRLTSRA